ncbi:hypothetical protein [Phytohabitans kaempferiae]|uniref:Uncharacterized protein n=1 Tax=Phytohabitans kaempferiae TaxID=1620943 RepID=A0ABV6LUX0_9ACTN
MRPRIRSIEEHRSGLPECAVSALDYQTTVAEALRHRAGRATVVDLAG